MLNDIESSKLCSALIYAKASPRSNILEIEYLSKIWSQQQLQQKTSCEKWGKMWELEVDDHKEI
jgi:hypothetical protein